MVELGTFMLAGFLAALALVPVCRAMAHRLGRVARPTADRWHQRPTALLGGVAIWTATFLVALFIRPFGEIAIYAAVGTAIFAVGLTDDLITLKPYTKLIAQLVLASVFVFFKYRLGWVHSEIGDALLTLFWIVGITNALNLLDNMDGLCAGVSVIAGLSLLAGLLPVPGARPEALLLGALVGAAAGFLVYNVNPASIFMGDSGSLTLGMLLAGMSLELPRHEQGANVGAVVFAPVLVMMIPIFDTALVTVMRLASGKKVWDGGRDHSSHRLVAIGLPERQAVFVLWGLAGLGAVGAWGLGRLSVGYGSLAVALFALSMALFAIFLTRVKVYENADALARRRGPVTRVVVDFMYKRRVAEVLMDFFLIVIAYYGAFSLRFEAEFKDYAAAFQASLPIVLGVQMLSLFAVGAYRGLWRYFGLMDGVVIAKGVALGTVLTEVSLLYIFRFANYSRAAFAIYAMLLLLLMTTARASLRLMSEFVQRRRLGPRLVIYGAGNGGALAVRELGAGELGPARMLGFIDDDPSVQRSRVHGYPVLGGFDALIGLVNGGAVDRVVVSTLLMDRARLAAITELCHDRGVEVTQLRVQFDSAVS